MNTVRLTISQPRTQYREMEAARKKLGLSRSGFFQGLIEAWLRSAEEKERVRQYIEGYRRKPENLEELEAWAKASAEGFRVEGFE